MGVAVPVFDWIDRDDLLSAFGRAPTDARLEWFGISRAQFRRWAKKPGVRVPVALGRLIRYRQRFHLAELLGPDWDGFAVHSGALEFPGLNRALPVAELRSLWFYIQQVAFHKHHAERLARELAKIEAAPDSGFQPVFDDQARDALKMLHIVRDHDQAPASRLGSDHEVIDARRVALDFPLQLRRCGGILAVEGNHRQLGQVST